MGNAILFYPPPPPPTHTHTHTHTHRWSPFLNERFCILIQISLKFVPKDPVVLIQVMAWCWTGDKPLSEPMVTQFTTPVHTLSSVNQFRTVQVRGFCYIHIQLCSLTRHFDRYQWLSNIQGSCCTWIMYKGMNLIVTETHIHHLSFESNELTNTHLIQYLPFMKTD